MIEISGQERKIESFIEAVRPFGILEMVRAGRIALLRGKTTSVDDRPWMIRNPKLETRIRAATAPFEFRISCFEFSSHSPSSTT